VAAGTRSPSSDPFAILGVEPSFEIDLEALERRHRELSRALHPDRYAGRPASERREALGRAIEVNEAWRVLKDPISRAQALLSNRGILVEEGREPQPNPEFLMEIMEYREQLSEVRQSKKREALSRLTLEMKKLEAQTTRELAEAFETDGQSVQDKLGRLRYYRRFLDEAAAIEDELG
jgi:molecular chaperone HscB